MKPSKYLCSLLCFLAACIWGFSFVSQSKGMEYMHPFTFNGVRNLMAAMVLFLFLLSQGKILGEKVKTINWKRNVIGGIWCGLALFAASTLQQVGILYTSVGKAGFITTLYIIFVPIAGIFLKKKVPGIVWFAAMLAACGMYLLCMNESASLNTGDILVFLCAFGYTAQIMFIDHFAEGTDGVVLSFFQFLVCGVLGTIAAFIWGAPAWHQITGGIGALLYAAIMGSAVAYTFQIIGQKNLNPTVASLLLSLESVVATIAAWGAYKIGFLKADQTLTGRQIAGCAVVFAAVVLVQLPSEWFTRKRPNSKSS